jgi:hypothetical protein
MSRIDQFSTSQVNGSGARTYMIPTDTFGISKRTSGFSSDIPKLLLALRKDVLESPKVRFRMTLHFR